MQSVGTKFGHWMAYTVDGVYNADGIGALQGTFLALLNWNNDPLVGTINPAAWTQGSAALTAPGSRAVRRYATGYGPLTQEKVLPDNPSEPITFYESTYFGTYIGSSGQYLTGIALWPDPNGTLWDGTCWWADNRTYSRCTGTIHFRFVVTWWDPNPSDMDGTRFNFNWWKQLHEGMRSTTGWKINSNGIAEDGVTFYGKDYGDVVIGTCLDTSVDGTIATVVFGHENGGVLGFEPWRIEFQIRGWDSGGNGLNLFTLRRGVDEPTVDKWLTGEESSWFGTLYIHMKGWDDYGGTLYGTRIKYHEREEEET